MIQTDIFTIATSGLNSQQSQLNTTANNIANVNTEGYVRQRGNLEAQKVGGVLFKDVDRVFNRFAQEQWIRDTSSLGKADAYNEKITQLDNLLASESNSVAASMSRYFDALQTANDQPNNTASRQLVLSHADTMVGQFNSLDSYFANAMDTVNEEISSLIGEANNLISTISELNEQIKSTQFATQTTGSEAVKNERDQAILELAKYMDIQTIPKIDGSTLVNLSSGQALVMEDGTFGVLSANGDPDPTRKDISLTLTSNTSISIPLRSPNLGGEVGGLVEYRDDVLESNRRELGQLSLALGDAMNQQNNLGMDLDGDLGTDLFTLPTFTGLQYDANALTTTGVNARLPEGAGNQITSVDYQITINAVNGGAGTVDYTVALLNPDGTPVTNSAGTAITQVVTGATAGAGTFVTIPAGNIGPELEIEFASGTTYTANDRFLIQPTKAAASNLQLAVNRPEDIALASPIRVESELSNLGSAKVTSTTVTNTTIGGGNAQSAFTGVAATPIQAPGSSPAGAGGVGAPARIVFTAADTFQVQDSANTVITTVAGATSLANLLNQASGTAGWTGNYGAALTGYPGYDLSIEGIPKAGDTFNINFNADGFNDNTNGRKLSALQDADTVLQTDNGSTSTVSFNEQYTKIVSDVGTKAASAQINYDAAVALERQASDWFNSESGVNLDEEAANLIRFQQAYTASARVLTTAQSLFDTILGAVR